MLLVISYDITDDKRRNNIASELKNFGQRVQKSVFECYVNNDDAVVLKGRLERIIDLSEDSIRYYYICGKDRWRIDFLGKDTGARDQDYFMV